MQIRATYRKPDYRVWVIGDLQYPDLAERCLTKAISDIESLDLSVDEVWYLGDSATSRFDGDPWQSPEVQLLEDFDVPVRFVMGNHDVERICVDGQPAVPMHTVVQAKADWRTTDSVADIGFIDHLGEIPVVFLSDHVAEDGSWCAHHGEHRHGSPSTYPYTKQDYQAFFAKPTAREVPIIVAGHNAFAGGNRPAALQDWFLPLPACVSVHLHGHAHIGDTDRLAHPYRTISYVQDQSIPQIDIASLEDRRDPLIRSAILEVATGTSLAIHLRDHTNREWLEHYARPLA